jgi:ABC-type Fe3+-hydroxamate transport system substrate-binding protein
VRGRVLIALAVVAALGGCQESGFDESKETQRPLKVQHALDPLTGTKVPGLAERPLTLSADTLGDTLALGVRPVRAALPGGRLPDYLRPAARGVEVVPPLTELDLAATQAADPDLILGTKEAYGDLYERLSRIAPTVMSEGDDWKLNLRLHGEALGRTNDAEELLIDWDNRVARVRDAIGGRKLVVSLPHPTPFAEGILADVGVQLGTEGDEVVRLKPQPEWSGGGLLAARAALADIGRSL